MQAHMHISAAMLHITVEQFDASSNLMVLCAHKGC
jgi:hypothetical protein